MIRKCPNHTLHTNLWHSEEEPQKTNSHMSSKKQLSRAASSLFIVEMIAKLKTTQRYA